MQKYKEFFEITKELLDSVELGDVVKMNDWKRGMVVRGVSENYFVMAVNMFGQWCYSACEKLVRTHNHNQMTQGMFHIGTDSWVFGYGDGYHFDDPDWVSEYLASFDAEGEEDRSEISVRRGVPIYSMAIRKAARGNGGRA